ncbi:MAG: hypothetical protein Q9182_001135 [Xanthomendoza sp. 2 TL-2023]
MPTMDKVKAQQLIAQLERHQQQQIQCLQTLFGLASKDDTQEVVHVVKDAEEVTDIAPTDPAARFIVANALNNLAQFSFRRDPKYLTGPRDFDQTAFYVIDFAKNRQITLDTDKCFTPSNPASDPSEVLRTLFKQVPRLPMPVAPTLRQKLKAIGFREPPRNLWKESCMCYHQSSKHSYRKSLLIKPSVVDAFTPSALSTILLCTAKDNDYDYATIYAALRRHLSTYHADRHYYGNHGWADEVRQGILFEDRNFTNSKRYFWALQSLRLFAEHIEGTLRSLHGITYCAKDFDGGSPEGFDERERYTTEFGEKFGDLRDRIERKRQEVQSLSDGVSGFDLLRSVGFACAEKKRI